MTRYRKTYVAALAAILTTISLAWDANITQADATALTTAWAGVLAVYWFPNDAPAGDVADPNVSERGDITPGLVTAIASVVMAVILVIWAAKTDLIG